jgi:hypothetical protein
MGEMIIAYEILVVNFKGRGHMGERLRWEDNIQNIKICMIEMG